MPRPIRKRSLKTKAVKGARNYVHLTTRENYSNDNGFLIRIQKEMAYHFSGDESKNSLLRNPGPAKVFVRNE